MPDESASATMVMSASAEAIFAVLADPVSHAAIDGTGWVCEPVDTQPLTAAGQVFRMGMYHPGHPDGNWRYDLAPAGPSATAVTLTYDWSAVPDSVRKRIGIPPFPPDHLRNSLAHLAGLVGVTGQPAIRTRPT